MTNSRSPLADAPFSYQVTKAGKVLVSHLGQQVTVLQGKAASKFVSIIDTLDTMDAQRHLAAVTGQYKFGNERNSKT